MSRSRTIIVAILAVFTFAVAACGSEEPTADLTGVSEEPTEDPATQPTEDLAAEPTEAAEATAEPATTTEAVAEPSSEDQTGSTELTPVTFQLNWTWYPADHSYFQVALDEGFFEDEGLDVTIQEGTGSGTTLTLIGTGSVPLGFVDAGTMMRGQSEGVDTVKSIGVVNQVSPMAAIFPADKGYETIEDLRGARIAGTQGDALSQILPAALAANGLSEDDIEFISTANPPAKEVAVLNDNADALLGYYTEQAPRLEATNDVDMDWITFADAGVNTLNMSVVANTGWLEENGEAASAFLAALQQAIEFTADNPEEAASIFSAAHDDFSEELARGQIEESLTLLHTEATEDEPYLVSAESDWQSTQDLLVEHADLQPSGEADGDVTAYYTNDYIP